MAGAKKVRVWQGWPGAGRGRGRPAALGVEAHGLPHTLPSQVGAARRTVLPWVPSRFYTDCVWGLGAAQQEAGSRHAFWARQGGAEGAGPGKRRGRGGPWVPGHPGLLQGRILGRVPSSWGERRALHQLGPRRRARPPRA